MNQLSFLKDRLRTRSIGNAFSRLQSIFSRYGLGIHKFSESFLHLIQLVKKYDVEPTFPLTASVLDRHPNFFSKIQEMGVELAIHGYKHIDYTQLKEKEVIEHIQSAIEVFQRHAIKYSGYRFPYLRHDEGRIDLLQKFGFKWDSSVSISWNSLDLKLFSKRRWNNYLKIINNYKAKDADTFIALPRMIGELVEIPVSVPDDDILVERLGLKDGEMISQIWERILSQVRKKGELLVLQVHPERFRWYRNSLERILQIATENEDVWIASLGEIARWWREKEKFKFEVEEVSRNRFRVTTQCPDRATVLLKKEIHNNSNTSLLDNYEIVNERVWELESPLKPMICVNPDTSQKVINFLKSEGFAFEVMEKGKGYSLSLNNYRNFDLSEKKQVCELINNTKFPMLRFWRWPKYNQCCLAITGDIDSADLWDFYGRCYG